MQTHTSNLDWIYCRFEIAGDIEPKDSGCIGECT